MRYSYNKKLLPRPHYKKLTVGNVGHLLLLRDAHPNAYPEKEDFNNYTSEYITKTGAHRKQKRSLHKKIFASFISSHSEYNAIFQSDQFLKGLSLNLYSIFRKRDAFQKVKKNPNDNDVHKDWNPGENGIIPRNLIFLPNNRSTGIRCKDLSKIRCDFNCLLPDMTTCMFKLGLKFLHKPTFCNFWHCELVMYMKTPAGTIFVGKDEIRDSLVNDYGVTGKKADKLATNMAKSIRSEFYRFLIMNPRGRKCHLNQNAYIS